MTITNETLRTNVDETRKKLMIRLPKTIPLNGRILMIRAAVSDLQKLSSGIILPGYASGIEMPNLPMKYFAAAISKTTNDSGTTMEKFFTALKDFWRAVKKIIGVASKKEQNRNIIEVGDELIPFVPPKVKIEWMIIHEYSGRGIFEYGVIYDSELAGYRKSPYPFEVWEDNDDVQVERIIKPIIQVP